jgi:outer membrane protein, multidrug efflux system
MSLYNISRLKVITLLFLTVIMLSSCHTLEPLKETGLTAEDKLYRDLDISDSTNIADIPWKSLFTDTDLQTLIEEALANNSDMKIAVQRIDKAKASLLQSQLNMLPSLELDGNAIFNNANSNGTGSAKTFELYGSSSWEVDIWGKLRSTRRANLNSYLQSQEYKRAVQTQLIANVATYYYTLLSYDAQLNITEQTLKNREDEVETMKVLKATDVITGADLVQSEAGRYSAEVSIPDLKQNIYETENALSVLIGLLPGEIKRGTLDEQQISVELKTGLPVQMLSNRPDVKEAEYQLRYYYEMTNVARSYFYPSLNITAYGGLTETDLSKLLDAKTLFYNVTGGLVEPLFNKGANMQRLKVAKANQEEYLISYKQTLLEAGAEVTNALHDYENTTEKMSIRSKQIGYLEKAVDYTMELLKYSSATNYTDVLTSENNLLSAQLGLVSDKLRQMEAVIKLYHSLGGGWKE